MKKILHILVLPQMAGSQRISLEILKNLPDDEFDGRSVSDCSRLPEQKLSI